MSELPKLDIHFQRYRSHKIIEAFKIASIVVENDGIHASHANRTKVPNMQPVSQSRAALESLQKLKRGTEGKHAITQ